jgi:hypothetical protein
LFFTIFGESFFGFQKMDKKNVQKLKMEKTFPKKCKKQKFVTEKKIMVW